jgi:hypothetical protein
MVIFAKGIASGYPFAGEAGCTMQRTCTAQHDESASQNNTVLHYYQIRQ